MTGFPALADDGDSVSIRLFDTAEAAIRSHRAGVVRLLRIALREQVKMLERAWSGFTAVALTLRSRVAPDRLLADWIDAVCDRAFVGDDVPPRTGAQFEAQKQRARARLPAVRDAAQRLVSEIGAEWSRLGSTSAALAPSLRRLKDAIEKERDAYVFPGFLLALGWDHVTQVPRYLRALERRLQKYAENPGRDARHAAAIDEWRARWHDARARASREGAVPLEIEDFRWWIDEYAVALFAQELKTPFPVSHKRLERRWAEIAKR
jgi:ATP-dependent helicase HrpA